MATTEADEPTGIMMAETKEDRSHTSAPPGPGHRRSAGRAWGSVSETSGYREQGP